MNHAQKAINLLIQQTEKSVIGQRHVVEALVIGLLTNGHVLLEGLPGTAKTRSVKSLAKRLNTSFGRIQFTPDLLPSDVTGTEVYQEREGKPQLHFQAGPIFNSIVLADEVNRAPHESPSSTAGGDGRGHDNGRGQNASTARALYGACHAKPR